MKFLPEGFPEIPDLLAQRRLEYYYERFVLRRFHAYGFGHFALACYASLPSVLTPDLLHKLWLNFKFYRLQGEPVFIHPVAPADLLLSPLLEEIGFELYEMVEPVRQALLKYLQMLTESPEKNRFHFHPLTEVAQFLLDYARHDPMPGSAGDSAFREAQEWTALSYLDPSAAFAKVAKAFETAENRQEQLRYRDAIEKMASRFEVKVHHPKAEPPKGYPAMRALTQVMRDLTMRREKQLEAYEQLYRQPELLSERALNVDGVVAIEISTEARQKMAAASVAVGRKVRALVVGVSQASTKNYSTLEGANDAKLFASHLRKMLQPEHIELTLLTNERATKHAILQSWSMLVEDATEQDDLVFYISSNATKGEGDKQGHCWCVCFDTKENLKEPATWLSDEEILVISKKAVCKSITAVLEVPYSATPHWLDTQDERMLVLATAKHSQVPYNLKQNIEGQDFSAFTWSLCQVLQEADFSISNRKLFLQALQKFEGLEQVKATYGNELREKHTPQVMGAPAALNRFFLGNASQLVRLQDLLRNTGFLHVPSSGLWDADTAQALQLARAALDLPQGASKQALILSLSALKERHEKEKPPLFLFVFSDPEEQIPGVRQEKEFIEDTLGYAFKKLHAELLILTDPTPEELEATFKSEEYRNRFHWFHFAGNGTQEGLHLKQGAFDLSKFLDIIHCQENLRIVVLNACFSDVISELLTGLSVWAAIAIKGNLSDAAALKFSKLFYQDILNGKSIEEAFPPMEKLEEEVTDPHRSISHMGKPEPSPIFLLFKSAWASKLVEQWRLSDYRLQKPSASELALTRIEEAKKTRATFLDLGNCGLTEIPEEVFELDWLEELILSNAWHEYEPQKGMWTEKYSSNKRDKNRFSKIPAAIKNLRSLIKLVIGDINDDKQQATSLEPLSSLVNLRHLNVVGNHISSIEPLKNLKSLEILDASGNQIESLEPLTVLTNLKMLGLRFNRIESLKPLRSLINLTHLDVGFNLLRTLEGVENLHSLKELLVPENQLVSLEPVAMLNDLEVLKAWKNQLTSLESLENLTNLNLIHVHRNAIHSLQPILPLINKGLSVSWEWREQSQIVLEENPLEIPPIEIVQEGSAAILEYFRSREEEGVRRLYEANLFILGEGGAGKTSLYRKLIDPAAPLPEEADTTRGSDIHVLHFPLKNGGQFRMNVWDFGGQEVYHATHQFFLNKRSLYLLVDDTSKNDKSANDPTFRNWLQMVSLLGGGSPLLIVQNEKGDRSKSLDLRSMKGRFDFVQGSLAVNLLTGRGLDKLRAEIEHLIQNLPHVGTPLPRQWVVIREEVEKRTAKQAYMSEEDWLSLCAANRVDEQQALQLSQYLHDLGVFLHFQDNEALRQTIILQKEWATNACYRVLDDEQVKRRGRFGEENLQRIWQEEQWRRRIPQLLALMLKFELCYELPDSQPRQWLVPQLLPDSQPDDHHWEEHGNLSLRYRYDFLPKGLLSRIIVRLHRFVSRPDLAWRSGVLLERLGAKAEVMELAGERDVIRIRVSGNDPALRKELLVVLAEEFDKLHDSFSNLKVEKLIPCICEKCQSETEPYFYEFNNLLRRRQAMRRT
ncbi:MAG: COR domain-containing protein, partial [Bacteroidota bacterium]